MTQNIPLAIVLGIFGSFCFALSAYVQHDAVGGQGLAKANRERMAWSRLISLVKSPRWLGGLALMGVSAVVQIVALTLAPVSVVQPVGLLAFPWSVLLSARKEKHKLSPQLIGAVAVTVVATLAFTLLAAAFASPSTELKVGRILVAAFAVYFIAFGMTMFGSRGPREWRCLFWASGGALFYGLEAALVKALIEYSRIHPWLTSPLVWGIVIALVAGSALAGALVQQGYATGPAEVVVGSMTVTSPVVAVLFGIVVLGEGRYIRFISGTGMLVLGLVAIGGVVAMTWLHPHNDKARGALAAESTPPEASNTNESR